MKRFLLCYAALLSLAACQTKTDGSATLAAPVKATTVTEVRADVQLFCSSRGFISAMAISTGGTVGRVIAQGASSAYVAAVCAAADAVAVAPPADAASRPTLIIPATSISLQ